MPEDINIPKKILRRCEVAVKVNLKNVHLVLTREEERSGVAVSLAFCPGGILNICTN